MYMEWPPLAGRRMGRKCLEPFLSLQKAVYLRYCSVSFKKKLSVPFVARWPPWVAHGPSDRPGGCGELFKKIPSGRGDAADKRREDSG